jgi:2-methylaconitate cis-trans-isomerase PrpF
MTAVGFGQTSQQALPAVLMRGGTSKGVFLHARDVPPPGPACDALLLDLMGSPDPMQIDGLGGTYSSTSKVVIVAPGDGPGVDVRYWFAQVGVDRAVVDWSGNCGNLTTAVAPFAIDDGLIPAVEPETVVRLRNENTGARIVARVPVRDGRARVEGDLIVPGVPQPGAPISTEYLGPAGHVLGAALPTGSVVDRVPTPDGALDVSLLDVTHPYAFVRAADLELDLTRATPPALNGDELLLARLERLRAACAVYLGVAGDLATATQRSPAVPRLVIVQASDGAEAEPEPAADLCALATSMGKVHHALPMTGALCAAAAALLPGTIPNLVRRGSRAHDRTVRIRHPKGVVVMTADVDSTPLPAAIRSVGVVRTARRLMAGTAYVRTPLEWHGRPDDAVAAGHGRQLLLGENARASSGL